jgi:amino acid transporter
MVTSKTARDLRLSDGGLRRDVGFIGMLWASEGSIIGSGWLVAALFATQLAGPAALIAWLIGGGAVIVLALVHAELGGMYPVAGGTARFPHYAFGSVTGFAVGWFSWLQAVTVAPIEVEAALQYATNYVPWLTHTEHGTVVVTGGGYAVSVVLMAIFTAINLLGVRRIAMANTTATWWKVGVPLLAILVLAITKFDTGNFSAGGGFAPYGVRGIFEAVSLGGVIFALEGFEQAIQLGAESSNPGRNIPRAVISSMVIGTIIYILLQVVFIGALSHHDFAHGWSSLSFSGIFGPFAGIAKSLGLGWLAIILYIDAIISPGATGMIYTTTTSRISYGMSRNGYLPTIFEQNTSRTRVPWFSLIFAFLVGLIVFLPFPGWQTLVGFVSSANALMYAAAPLAYGALKKSDPNRPRPYKLPGGRFWAPVSFVVANLIIYWSSWEVVWKLMLAVVIGFAIFGATYIFGNNPRKPKLDWTGASWLIPYLAGIAIISYAGQFKSPTHLLFGLPHIPFWWDIGTVAVWSLVIYFWAIASRLPTPKVEEYVREVEVTVENPAALE